MAIETTFRQYLIANLFDGNEGGEVTMKVKTLVDEVEDLFMHFMLAQVSATTINTLPAYYGWKIEREDDGTPT